MSTTNVNQEEIRVIFSDACARRELLILTTQYLKLESNFVLLEGSEVYAKTTSGGEDALSILKVKDISLRFPHKLDFLEATSTIVGIGDHNGEKLIRFELPQSIQANDGRSSPRIGNLKDAYATFPLRGDKRVVKATVINISDTGARLSLEEALPNNEFRVKDRIMLSLYLSKGVSITSPACVRHLDYKTFGIEFRPGLADSDVRTLSAWAFSKQERERDIIVPSNVTEEFAVPQDEVKDVVVGGGILFVSWDSSLEAALGASFGPGMRFYSAMPSLLTLKEALTQQPHMVILHMPDGSDKSKRLIKSLEANIPEGTPVLLLGTDVSYERLFETRQELKKVLSSISWTPEKSQFLQRLALGMMRGRYG